MPQHPFNLKSSTKGAWFGNRFTTPGPGWLCSVRIHLVLPGWDDSKAFPLQWHFWDKIPSSSALLLLSQDTLLLSLRIFTVLSASRRLLMPGNTYSGNRHPLNIRPITAGQRNGLWRESLLPQQVFTDFALGLAQPRVLRPARLEAAWGAQRGRRSHPAQGAQAKAGDWVPLDLPQKPRAKQETKAGCPRPPRTARSPPGALRPPRASRTLCGWMVAAGKKASALARMPNSCGQCGSRT